MNVIFLKIISAIEIILLHKSFLYLSAFTKDNVFFYVGIFMLLAIEVELALIRNLLLSARSLLSLSTYYLLSIWRSRMDIACCKIEGERGKIRRFHLVRSINS